MSTETVKSAARRVRALLGQFHDPLAALDHITQAAEAHIAALAPSFAELEASPLQNVPTFDTQQPAAKAFEQRPARRVLEPPARQAESRQPVNAAAPEARSSAAPPGASAPTPPTTRVLPASPRTALSDAIQAMRDSIRSSNESKANTLSRLSESNRVAELISEQQRTIADASKELAGEEGNDKEERASLGDLAGAVLRRGRARVKEEAEANERNTSPPVIGAAPPLATTGFAQGVVLRPAMQAARPASPTQPSLRARSTAQPNDLPLPHSNQGAPLPDVGPTVRRGVPFYFDPLEARPAADEADDALADRIGQVLREQARRQGVDLT